MQVPTLDASTSAAPAWGGAGVNAQCLTQFPPADDIPAAIAGNYSGLTERNVVGSGAYALVLQCQHRSNVVKPVAIKVIAKEPYRARDMLPQAEREVRLHCKASKGKGAKEYIDESMGED